MATPASLSRKADAGSVPCDATNIPQQKKTRDTKSVAGFFLLTKRRVP